MKDEPIKPSKIVEFFDGGKIFSFKGNYLPVTAV
jgi:hypothetical protein